MTNKYLEKIAEIGAVDWHVRGHGNLSHRDEVLGSMGIGALAGAAHPVYSAASALKAGHFADSTALETAKTIGKHVGKTALFGAGVGLAAHTIGSEVRRRKMNNALAQYEQVP